MNKSKQFNIRKALPEDISKIFDFEREYIIEYERNQLEKWDQSADKTKELLMRSINSMFTATVKSKLAGHGFWGIYENKPCVYSLYVDKDYRRNGIAKEIMIALENDLIHSSYHEVTLSTLQSNPAQFLFKKLDYRIIKIKDGWIHYKKKL